MVAEQGCGVLWAELRGGLQLCRRRAARQHSQVKPSPRELVAEPGGSGCGAGASSGVPASCYWVGTLLSPVLLLRGESPWHGRCDGSSESCLADI